MAFSVDIKLTPSLHFSYVDNQLRRSKRFDAQGIAEEYPQLVVPFPRRRSSSSNSLSSLSSSSRANNEEFSAGEGGQLRYWTSDMCRQSPHLFDFVVTVRCTLQILRLASYENVPRSSEGTEQCSSRHGCSSASYLRLCHLPSAL